MSTVCDSDEVGPTAAELVGLLTALSRRSPATCDAERIDRVRALEDLKAAAAAAQARETVALKQSRIARDRVRIDGTAARDGRVRGDCAGSARVTPRRAVDTSAWRRLLSTSSPTQWTP